MKLVTIYFHKIDGTLMDSVQTVRGPGETERKTMEFMVAERFPVTMSIHGMTQAQEIPTQVSMDGSQETGEVLTREEDGSLYVDWETGFMHAPRAA